MIMICTRMHLYTIVVCRDDVIMNICPCLLLVAISAICHWHSILYYLYVSIWILCNYGWICITVCMIMISLHPLSYNIVRCGFCSTVQCLSGDHVSLTIWECHWFVPLFFVQAVPRANRLFLCEQRVKCELIKTCPVDECQYVMITAKSLWSADVTIPFWLMALCPSNNKVSLASLVLS